MNILDKRLHAFRADLADANLKGKVEAAQFVEGQRAVVGVPIAGLRPRPYDLSCGIDTELLFGEEVTVFETADGWCWVKASCDDYVGYVPEHMLSAPHNQPTHLVVAQRSFVYPEPELRKPPVQALSMGSRVYVTGFTETRGNHYAMLDNGMAIFAKHLVSMQDKPADDHVEVAARLWGTPYLWGGRSGFGIDCSGLVQLSLLMTGRKALRDCDLQFASLGRAIERDDLQRGDLVFWKGHVAIMEDLHTMIHASGYAMAVVRENLNAAIARISPLYGQPTGYRRP